VEVTIVFLIGFLLTEIRHRWQIVKDSKDAGYTTETVIGIALLAALAIAVLAIIAAKITAKANSINLDGGGTTT
jgi:tRNA A37 threonylcarbamoyladenosine synthetase subunit TsaC/SUA5/YrdC